MNRRGFVATLIAVIAYPFIKIFGIGEIKYIPPVNDIRENISHLEKLWLADALLGVGCNCKNKITIEPGAYELWQAFKAYVTYCPKHGFDTDCWMCNPNVGSTEVCNKNHYPFSEKITLDEANEMVGSDGKYAEQLVNEHHKDNPSLAEAVIISAKKYLNI